MQICNQLKRVQGPNESVRTYADDLLKRMPENGVRDDQQMLDKFVEGLISEIQVEVRKHEPQSCAAAEKKAIAIEDAIREARQRAQPPKQDELHRWGWPNPLHGPAQDHLSRSSRPLK